MLRSTVRLAVSAVGGLRLRVRCRQVQAMARADGGVPNPEDGVSADGVSGARLRQRAMAVSAAGPRPVPGGSFPDRGGKAS